MLLKSRRVGAWVAGAAIVLAASAALGQVRSPWVTTDRTVDCSSYETIVKGVLKDGMTDEQKAIALFNFYRQMVYHYKNLPESRDPIKCINVMGNTLCGSQATCMKGLLEAAGLKVRIVSHPGHTFYEVFYDGKWHGYDTMTNFYVYTRGPKRNVASFEELNKDPSLIRDAVKEGRACPGMCPCGDDPMRFARKIEVLNYKVRKTNWSVKDYALRPGEQIVRSWWPHGRPLPGSYRAGREPGPMHTCGSRDRRNPRELFKFWEPYGIPKYGRVSISYRHYFNGWMEYSPDLSSQPLAGQLASGELVVPVKCPFYITAASATFQAECPGAGDAVEVAVSVDNKPFQPVMKTDKPGSGQYRAVLDRFVVRRVVGRHQYKVRFKLSGKARLKRLYLKTIFVHNAMAAPHLMPGKNKVTVTVANPEALKLQPMTVVYRYKEAPNWTELKVIERKVTSSPFTFQVDLPETEKLPQMQDLTLRYGKLAWVPARKTPPNKVICDFSRPESVKAWVAGKPLVLSHDGVGMLMTVGEKSTYPQARMQLPKQDWSGYQNIVVELENLGPAPQSVVLRVASNDDLQQRSDVEAKFGKGKGVFRIPVAGLRKTKLKAVTRIYLMLYQVPEKGSKVRILRIYLEPKQPL